MKTKLRGEGGGIKVSDFMFALYCSDHISLRAISCSMMKL